jgi:hypothetical protein
LNNVGAFAPTLFESFGFAETSPFQSKVLIYVFSNEVNNRSAVILRVSLCETSCFAAQNHFIESIGELK